MDLFKLITTGASCGECVFTKIPIISSANPNYTTGSHLAPSVCHKSRVPSSRWDAQHDLGTTLISISLEEVWEWYG